MPPLTVTSRPVAVGRAVSRSGRGPGRARDRPVRADTTPELVAASFAAIERLRIDGRAARQWAPLTERGTEVSSRAAVNATTTSGFAQARDGWVRLHANYPHHAAALTATLGVSSRPELDATVAALPAAEIEDRVSAAGGIAVAVRTRAEWARHPHGASVVGAPWVEVEAGASRPALPEPRERAGPLDGVRVLDLTRVIAGPTCSQLLACLGADGLRIDPPHRPELSDQYLSNAMGKRSVALDLRRSGARLDALLASAHVVLLGYRPGALARVGLDPVALRERHPDLVVAALSAWGEAGPWGRRPGFDSIVQAACGIADACGEDGRPGALPVQALDHASGYAMAARVITLLARGRGGLVRVSLLGAARTLLDLDAPRRRRRPTSTSRPSSCPDPAASWRPSRPRYGSTARRSSAPSPGTPPPSRSQAVIDAEAGSTPGSITQEEGQPAAS